jgi:hypothetical protein
MSNQYFFAQYPFGAPPGDVLDVVGGQPNPEADLQIYQRNLPDTANQFWTFAPDGGLIIGDTSYWFIQSQLGHNLVVDIRGDDPNNTTRGLQVYPEKSSSNPKQYPLNQLWTPVIGPGVTTVGGFPDFSFPNGSFFIQSAMGDNLVATVGANQGRPANFVGVAKKQPSGQNQLWQIGNIAANEFAPKAELYYGPSNANQFFIRGQGFAPASPVGIVWNYSTPSLGDTNQMWAGLADFSGNFASQSWNTGNIPGWSPGGTLFVNVSQPMVGPNLTINFSYTIPASPP